MKLLQRNGRDDDAADGGGRDRDRADLVGRERPDAAGSGDVPVICGMAIAVFWLDVPPAVIDPCRLARVTAPRKPLTCSVSTDVVAAVMAPRLPLTARSWTLMTSGAAVGFGGDDELIGQGGVAHHDVKLRFTWTTRGTGLCTVTVSSFDIAMPLTIAITVIFCTV